METSIRILRLADITLYREARLRAFQEASESFSESYEDEVQLPFEHFQSVMGTSREHFTVGHFQQNELVGFATFKRDRRSKAMHKSYIHTMYVSPAQRGKKVAQGLLQFIIDFARSSSGLEQIHLWVLNPRTSVARHLYVKAGWAPQGLFVQDDLIINGSYVDAEYLTLRL